MQVVYKICLHVQSSRRLLWKAGAVQSLLQLVSREKAAVGFHRDRAAVALATLAEAAEVKAWLRVRGFAAAGAHLIASWRLLSELLGNPHMLAPSYSDSLPDLTG
jgi:hypothetical protein